MSISRRDALASLAVGAGTVACGAPGAAPQSGATGARPAPVAAHTFVEAHRGLSAAAPENTMAAIVPAIELGVDRVEIDVHATADGRAVVIHDDTLDRTTNGSGPVAATALADLRRLDAGAWKDPRFHGEKVPTLREVLELARGRTMIDIDLKTPGAIGPMVDDLRALGMVGEVVITGITTTHADALRAAEPGLSLFLEMGRAAPDDDALIALAVKLAMPTFSIDHRRLTPAFIRKAKLHGLGFNAWTVNDERRMRELIAQGVDAILTDRADVLLAILGRA